MEISLMQEFLVLVEKGNYISAADSLYISQPTLSRHIQRIEDELGVTLFERNTRRLELTKEGTLFLPYARQIVSIEREYMNIFHNIREKRQESLIIGTIPLMAPYGISDMLQEFGKTHPDIFLNVIVMSRLEMMRTLDTGSCDFVFLRELEKPEDDYIRMPLAEDCMALVLPKTHALAGQSTIRLEQVKDEKMIFPANGSETYRICLQACRDAGFVPRIAVTGKGPETAVDLVLRNMGIAFSLKRTCEYMEMRGRVALADIEPEITARVSLAYKPGSRRECAREFLSYMERFQKK